MDIKPLEMSGACWDNLWLTYKAERVWAVNSDTSVFSRNEQVYNIQAYNPMNIFLLDPQCTLPPLTPCVESQRAWKPEGKDRPLLSTPRARVDSGQY